MRGAGCGNADQATRCLGVSLLSSPSARPMNAERVLQRPGNGHAAKAGQASPAMPAAEAAPAKSRSLKPLLGLQHFILRYKGKLALAGVGLVLGASAVLALPIAVRQV